jgi:hypothetical protein
MRNACCIEPYTAMKHAVAAIAEGIQRKNASATRPFFLVKRLIPVR